MANILIVEDDIHINELVKRNLMLVGHRCTQCYTGRELVEQLQKEYYELILLDVMLPELSGFECMEYIKNTPVIFVTAKGALQDKLKGLSIGAEDYIVKPFEMLELVARVDVVLRRYQTNEQIFQLNGTTVYLEQRRVEVNGVEVDMTPREFKVLEALIINKNIALSREKLLELAWGYDYEGETKTVDVHIQKLRKKLDWENEIITVKKLGYRLEART